MNKNLYMSQMKLHSSKKLESKADFLNKFKVAVANIQVALFRFLSFIYNF